MKKTQGAIGFNEQKSVLEAVTKLSPEDACVTLMGGRFLSGGAAKEPLGAAQGDDELKPLTGLDRVVPRSRLGLAVAL
jgi:hypothetical protein